MIQTSGQLVLDTGIPNSAAQSALNTVTDQAGSLTMFSSEKLSTLLLAILFFLLASFSLSLLPFLVLHHLLDGSDVVRLGFAKALEVQILDKFGKWNLPRFLFVVRLATELLRVHPEFACHLDVRVGQMETLPRVNPRLVLRR